MDISEPEKDHEDFPNQSDFKIGGLPITNIKEPHETTRILGVHLTMDSDPTNTFQHTIKCLNHLNALMYRKSIEGPMAKMIANVKLIPTVAYLLQTTPVSKTQLLQLERTLKKITKIKHRLPMSTPDRIIFNKELGVGLTSITDELCKQTLSNYQVFFRSEGIVGEFSKELNKFYENHLKLPLPLLEAPKRLNFRTTKKKLLSVHL